MAEAILNQPQFQDADKAREYLEALRWPQGAVCPHCGSLGKHLTLTGPKCRPGLYKCADCYQQFTVTVGTVFERSKIGLHVWLQAVHLMCASKKGVSAKQLERMLGVTYKTAWFMAHRIREAMKSDNGGLLGGGGGIVEADETYWGKATDENDKPVIATKEIKYAEGKSITHENSIFAGSGARHAVMCWAANKCAKRSVQTASQFDPATGGEVKYVDFQTNKHNLGSNVLAPGTIREIDKVLATGGNIMDTMKVGAVPFKISDLAANNSEIKDLQNDIAEGKLSAEAPCDAMYSEWTAEEKGKLKSFLGDVFGWKK